ncbi:hypothetical protein J6590_018209 [Homalodisca vitripennis]|nr:hypothetical protein J6590_018209 [Homalodisca vitripennis]
MNRRLNVNIVQVDNKIIYESDFVLQVLRAKIQSEWRFTAYFRKGYHLSPDPTNCLVASLEATGMPRLGLLSAMRESAVYLMHRSTGGYICGECVQCTIQIGLSYLSISRPARRDLGRYCHWPYPRCCVDQYTGAFKEIREKQN